MTYAPLVAVGGRLIYATCSILGDENERVIERFLGERDDFVRVPVKEIWGKTRAEELGQIKIEDLRQERWSNEAGVDKWSIHLVLSIGVGKNPAKNA